MPHNTRQRLRETFKLLMRNAGTGMTTPEIANSLGVTRQTSHKDIQRLEEDGIPLYQEGDRYFVDPSYHSEIHLSLPEAWFLYLPLRRLVRAGMGRFQLIVSLLHTITSLLREEMADPLLQELEEVQRSEDQIFTTLVRCWHECCLVELEYRRPNATRASQMTVAPWWFEPAVWSDASYLIGGLRQKDESYERITLKLDRILAVRASLERFERPPVQEILAAIEQTWGIWVGEEQPVRVRLRFHNRQYDRLRETRWHPTQQMMLDEEGYVIWEADISEPQEMLPFLRGWGADVEVLEPVNIREQIASEAAATAQLYGLDPDKPSEFF
ncbi:MAG: transcriptional regulator [Anaerolineae bacterium]|nr:transcriptional regulator [Anaerolineae bacterium]